MRLNSKLNPAPQYFSLQLENNEHGFAQDRQQKCNAMLLLMLSGNDLSNLIRDSWGKSRKIWIRHKNKSFMQCSEMKCDAASRLATHTRAAFTQQSTITHMHNSHIHMKHRTHTSTHRTIWSQTVQDDFSSLARTTFELWRTTEYGYLFTGLSMNLYCFSWIGFWIRIISKIQIIVE